MQKINPDPPEVQSARNLKDQLTVKELKFIEIYLSGDLNVDEAMIAAGYTGYNPKYLYRLGRKIVEKYENQAPDRRQIARAIGAGEVTILRGLLDLAQNARSEQVRRAAWADLASILGLKGEIPESFQGVTLMVYGQEEARRLGIQDEDAPTPALPPPVQTIRITK
ncbi:MAG: hypothetical protein ABSA04_13295 [Desulfobaccales bacterium]